LVCFLSASNLPLRCFFTAVKFFFGAVTSWYAPGPGVSDLFFSNLGFSLILPPLGCSRLTSYWPGPRPASYLPEVSGRLGFLLKIMFYYDFVMFYARSGEYVPGPGLSVVLYGRFSPIVKVFASSPNF